MTRINEEKHTVLIFLDEAAGGQESTTLET